MRQTADTAGPLSALNQHTISEESHLLHQTPHQPTTLDQLPTSTSPTPPSRSPSPLNISAQRPEGVNIPDTSVPTLPRDRDISAESGISDSKSVSQSSDSDSAHACSEDSDLKFPRSDPETSDASPFTMTVSSVRRDLESKSFFYDNEEALGRGGQAVIDKAMEIMTSCRNSPTSHNNAPLLKEAIQEYSSSTERTLVFNIFCILRQQKLRDVAKEKLSPHQEIEAIEWVKQAWKMDYLDCVFEADLCKDYIPDTSHTNNKATDIMFKDLPRISEPRPDVTYGLWARDIPQILYNILNKYHCELAKGVFLPFFLVEVKTQDAIAGEAENQCIRGGAVLVNGLYQWNRVAAGQKNFLDLSKKETTEYHKELVERREEAQKAHYALESRADLATIAFSLALSPPTATMHVHWREEWENGVEYWHTHVIHAYALRNGLEPYESLNMHMSNILDWGCTTRRMEIERQAKTIGKREWPGVTEEDVSFGRNKRQRQT